jgi:RNA recognition motif-containing protein
MKLYVGNFPANTSAKDLKDLFTPYGEVTSARVLTTQHGGHPRGFGYVEIELLAGIKRPVQGRAFGFLEASA